MFPAPWQVLTVELQHMGRKRSSKGVLALDGLENRLEEKNAIEVLEGPMMGKEGTVKHIFKSYVFVHSTDIKENAGMVCLRARQCRLLAGATRAHHVGGLDAARRRAHCAVAGRNNIELDLAVRRLRAACKCAARGHIRQDAVIGVGARGRTQR